MATSSEVSALNTATPSFDALFQANYLPLTRLIYRVLGDTAAAEELAAEALWKLHRSPPASNQNLPGWLYRTSLRLAFDALKKQKRRARYEAHAPVPAPAQTPEQALTRQQHQSRVRQVLATLNPTQSSLLILRSEGHTLAEIAAILALNPNSVGTLLSRADAAFRKEYVNRYGEQ